MTDATKAYYEAQIETLFALLLPIKNDLLAQGKAEAEVEKRVEEIMTQTLVNSHVGMNAEEAGRQIIRKAAFVGGPTLRKLFPAKEAS